MTNERAKEILTMLICQDTRVEADEYEEALQMAISALNSLEEVYAKGYNDGFTQAEVNYENDKALSQEPTEICCATCKHERLDDRNYKCEFENECLVEGKRGKYEFAYAKYEPIVEQEPCDDAISREDAEQMFRIIRSHLKPQDYKSAEEFNTRDLMLLNAEQMIHALPSVTQKWIPVSERLPEDKTYVLTTIKVPNRIAHARSGWYEGGFFHNDNGDVWKATDMEVIAWMPLPKPYKPQERSE